jgi:Protein of unknown function (DUF3108)
VYRKLGRRCILALVFCLVVVDAPAQTLPSPFSAEYEGSKFPFSARVTIALSRTGDYYRYTLRGTVRAAFLKWTDVYDCSLLRVDGDTFHPLEYVHRDSRDSRRDVHMRFDWKEHVARTTRGDGTAAEVTPLPDIAWDPMSIQVRLRADVGGADRGAERSYDVVEKGKIKHRRVRFGDVGKMPSGRDSFEVVKVEAVGSKRDNAFWFAKNYAWLPVRVSMGGVILELVSPPDKSARAAAPATDATPVCQ